MKNDGDPGELLMVGFEGQSLNARLRRYILEWRVGGVILFGRNIRGAGQVSGLCRELGALRREVADSPLLIAVDQEGGTVARLREGMTAFPGNLALGFAGSPEDAHRQGLITGRELRRQGITINLAPVLDLYSPEGSHSLGLRSLGGDPERVASLGSALIRGMQAGGIAATAKHFPGKGAARRDSHQELPVIRTPARVIRRRDLAPFRAAVEAGVEAVMTSHAAYPALDGGRIRPATLSRPVLTGLLRDEFHFRGVLISDDLGMGAVGAAGAADEAALTALRAGVDMLLLCHSPSARERTFRLLHKSGAADREVGERIRESRERIAALKARLPLPGVPPPGGEDDFAFRIARGAVSAERISGKGFAAGKKRPFLLVWFEPERTVEVGDRAAASGGPAAPFRAAGLAPGIINLPLRPSPEERARALAAAAGELPVVITACDAYRFPEQRELIGALLERRPDAVLAVVRDPRDAKLFPRAGTVLITRGPGPLSVRALAEVLAGRVKPVRENHGSSKLP
ncbi:MAG: beta-N-acetylhexosaminidase [PVC group bacterium]